MALPDVLGALVAYLKADSGVAAAVGARVYGGELPGNLPLTANMPPKCVVLRASGGFDPWGATYVPIGSTRYDVRCYGPSTIEAMAVWNAVYPALKHLRRHVRGNVILFAVTTASGAASLREPDTAWPFVFGSVNVTAAEEALTA